MADDLKNKTVKGVSWSFVEQVLTRGANFIIGIILARLLTPTDYGITGMIGVFIAVSQLFIDGGLSSALIRSKSPSDKDFSTVFIVNLVLSVLFYFILFFSATPIADFYEQPILKPFLRVVSLSLIISSLGSVQNTLLTIRVDFKTKSYISIITAIVSGAIGIVCAYRGLGAWSLAAQSLSATVICTLLLIVLVRWIPKMGFSKESFKQLFSFSSKLLASNIIRVLYDNAYYIVIGKKFSAASLGQYSRAGQFPTVANATVANALNRVAFPVLSQIQDDDKRLIHVYEKYIQLSCFILFPILLWMCGCAKPFILILLTEKWIDCIPLMQILCISLLLNSVTSLNLDLLYVKGRSDLALRLEIIKKIIAITILFTSMFFGLKAMCLGQVVYSFIDFSLNTFYTKKILNYGLWPQLRAMMPYLFCALAVLAEGLLFSHLFSNAWYSLLMSVIVCPLTYWLLAKLTHLYAYQEAKGLFLQKVLKRG